MSNFDRVRLNRDFNWEDTTIPAGASGEAYKMLNKKDSLLVYFDDHKGAWVVPEKDVTKL